MKTNPYGYFSEKFSHAFRHMAIGQETLRNRLCRAYMNNLFHLNQVPADFGEELTSKIHDLHSSMTCEEAQGNEGTIQATIAVMKEDEVGRCAVLVADIADELNSSYFEHSP